MKVAGSAVIGVNRDQAWTALRDPEVLVRTIPGCERLEETGPDTYRMTVNAGVASIKGVYQGEVSLGDPLAPESFTLRACGQGAPGTVDATVQVRLSEVDGGTRVDYDAEAVIGGMIGGVGQRMLGAAARRTAAEFFTAVDEHLRAPAEICEPVPYGTTVTPGTPLTPAAPGGLAQQDRPGDPARPAGVVAPAQARPAAGTVYERPAARHTETRPWVMLASFGMGAGVALAGAAVGWLLGRGWRRDA